MALTTRSLYVVWLIVNTGYDAGECTSMVHNGHKTRKHICAP